MAAYTAKPSQAHRRARHRRTTDIASEYTRVSRLLRGLLLQFGLRVRPVGVDDLPPSGEPLIHLGRVPADVALRSVADLRPVADHIEGQDGDVSLLLDLRIDHLGAVDVDLAL